MKNRKNIPVIDLPGEIWKDIPSFEGLYAVSNLQRVKSCKRPSVQNKNLIIAEKILRPGKHKYGYLKFTLCKQKKFHYVHLHRLMAETFMPNPNNFPCINHIDNNPENNSIENLEWCTWSHNTRHAYRQERLTKLGELNHMSKLTEKKVIAIFNSPESRKNLAAKYNVSAQAITDIKLGRRWCAVTGKRHHSVKKRICEE